METTMTDDGSGADAASASAARGGWFRSIITTVTTTISRTAGLRTTKTMSRRSHSQAAPPAAQPVVPAEVVEPVAMDAFVAGDDVVGPAATAAVAAERDDDVMEHDQSPPAPTAEAAIMNDESGTQHDSPAASSGGATETVPSAESVADAVMTDAISDVAADGVVVIQPTTIVNGKDVAGAAETKQGFEVVEVCEPKEEPRRMDLIRLLPAELSIKCLSHIRGPKTLSRCSKVSKAWYALAVDDALWRPLCKARWSTRAHLPDEFQLSHKVDYSCGLAVADGRVTAGSLVDLLSVREMRQILKMRHIDLKGVTEKDELKVLVATTTPEIISPRRLHGVRWGGKWKASFITEEFDSKRCVMSKDEICSIDWDFRMMHSNWPEGVSMSAKFNRDFTYDSDMFRGEKKMTWRRYGDQIQVEQYPALSVYRRQEDWGFILTNNIAIFHSKPRSSISSKSN